MNHEQLDHSTLAMQVVRVIRRQIFLSVIKSGDRIVEADIATNLGISRGPVRQAFVELEKEGFLVTYPRKGTYVAGFTIKDIEEIYTVRALLEGYAVTRSIQYLGAEDLNKLRGILDEIAEISAKKDIIEVTRKNIQFHEEIMKSSRHQRLYNTWRSLMHPQIQMLSTVATEFYTNVEEIKTHHETLLDMLIKKDSFNAKECLEKHILYAMDELTGYLQRSSEQKLSKQNVADSFQF